LKPDAAAPMGGDPPPHGLSMQMPPTLLTDCSHIDRVAKPQSSELPSEYCAQYGFTSFIEF
jgi:hypothetical protein